MNNSTKHYRNSNPFLEKVFLNFVVETKHFLKRVFLFTKSIKQTKHSGGVFSISNLWILLLIDRYIFFSNVVQFCKLWTSKINLVALQKLNWAPLIKLLTTPLLYRSVSEDDSKNSVHW